MYERYVKDYLNGMSLRQISEKYHISRNNLSKYLKEQNIPIRYTNITSRKYTCNENFFENIDSEEKAYWLGFIMADGFIQSHIHNNSKYIGIALKKEDKKHLEKFKNTINATYKLQEYVQDGYNQNSEKIRILICSSKMYNDLVNLGLSESKTFHESFPNIPQHLQRHFIRGVFDGDGSIYWNNRDKCLGVHICGNKDLLLGIINYFEKLGCSKNIQKSRSISDIHFSHTKALFVLNEMYKDSTVYLDRKYEIYKKYS